MTTSHKDALEYARYLKSLYTNRNSLFDNMEQMYLLKWEDEERVKKLQENVKITKSPDARNALIGAIRLLVATDPAFSVPGEEGILASDNSSKLEKAAQEMWARAGKIRRNPVHYDVVLSLLMFGEVHIGVTATKDMLNYSKNAPDAYKTQVEQIAHETPYLFDVYDPRTGYPDLNPYGLNSFYREVETTIGMILDQYPQAKKMLKEINPSRYSKRKLCHLWDMKEYSCWIEGSADFLVQEKHGLPFIPYVVALGEGSMLFAKPEDQRQPFLYTLYQSGLWDRLNLTLTVMYTSIFALGANPMFIEGLSPTGDGVSMDFSQPGGKITVPYGGSWSPVATKGILDPSLMQGLTYAEGKVGESTIYSQTLGEPLGANATFSMVALMHQAGRLPLVMPQKKGGFGIAEAMKIAFQWWKAENPGTYGGALADIKPDMIPQYPEIDCKLDIAMPQDRLQQANIATTLAGGQDPIVSKGYVREEVLGLGQPEIEQRRIWGEQAASLQAAQYFTDQMLALKQKEQQLQQMQQQQMQQQAQPPMPPQPQAPPMMPPEQMQPGNLPPELQGAAPPMVRPGGNGGQPYPPEQPIEGGYA